VSASTVSGAGTGPSGGVVALSRRGSSGLGGGRTSRGTRGLSTARAVLKVISFMAQHPDGVRAREVADELGKSVSTAYYLLASLHAEGFAVHDPGHGYRLRPEAAIGWGSPARPPGSSLSRSVEELFARTHRRSYLGQIEAGAIAITAVCGRQGIPRVPGLGPRIDRGAHALAMGKVVLSLLPEHGRRRYIERGLRRYTPQTITSPSALMSELARVRRTGFAVDRGEFDADYCSVAAPVLGERGRFLAVLGLSSPSRAFEEGVHDLIREVRDVALAVSGRDVRQRLDGQIGAVRVPPSRAA
jgi:DNA-binding IclR family transcriptional regulator